MILEPSQRELHARRARLLEALHPHAIAAICLFSPLRIVYLTGFAFIPTERPLALILSGEGGTTLFIPRLEKEHAETVADVVRIEVYPEYPGEVHPMIHLRRVLESLGLGEARVAVDSDGYGGGFGYQGPALGELLPDAKIVKVGEVIDRQMSVKSEEEVGMLRESARWGHLAHELLQRYTEAGRMELEISERAAREATAEMLATLGSSYRPFAWISAGAYAGFRGQIGPHSAVPHAMITNARIRSGDVLVTGATAGIAGYHSELERTMVMAPVSKEVERFFSLMARAQETALEAIRPGISCREVDLAVRRFFETRDLMPYWRHHTGHSIGIGLPNHQAPYLDIGDFTEIRPGMVFSIEPGIYVPGLGGFRHSDMVLVTERGIELLTHYRRDLASLTMG